jgi:hypothetical protein
MVNLLSDYRHDIPEAEILLIWLKHQSLAQSLTQNDKDNRFLDHQFARQ